MRPLPLLTLLVVATLPLGGCSMRSFVAAKVGNALSTGGSAWGREDDPELVREALPFALKTMESLAEEAPRHVGLRLALCRGYVGYAGGFLEPEAEAIEPQSFDRAQALRQRAERLYRRALGYCRAALDLSYSGAGAALAAGPDDVEATLARIDRRGVETLYWTGAAWGSLVAVGLDHPERIADLPTVRAIFERALVLDESFDRGALHEAMIVFDSMPAMMGGSAEAARRHFERSVELSGGRRAGPYVTWARASTVARQARREFRETLEKALAVNVELSPDDRLVNLVAQGRARTMLARIDDFFFADENESEPEPPSPEEEHENVQP